MCVTETESMATVCLTQVPTAHHWCVAVTYTRSTGVAPNTNITLVANGLVSAEREAYKYERAGWGGVWVRVGRVGRGPRAGGRAAVNVGRRRRRQPTDTRYTCIKERSQLVTIASWYLIHRIHRQQRVAAYTYTLRLLRYVIPPTATLEIRHHGAPAGLRVLCGSSSCALPRVLSRREFRV